MLYFEGDFSKSVHLAKNAQEKYNLYTNNCSQMTMRILAQSDTKYSMILSMASEAVVPSKAYNKVEFLYNNVIKKAEQLFSPNKGGRGAGSPRRSNTILCKM